ncbi:MAG TPA: zinc-binding alcohol dehydrogenase [Chloroflexota bacterium]
MVVRSLWFAGPHQVELRTEAELPLGATDVRIQTLASAISHGTEMLVFRGQVPDDLGLDLPTLRGSFGFPIKYGYASVGRVTETGPQVSAVDVGDRVFVHHPHQTEYVVPETMPIRLPAGLNPELGVFLANVETAINVVLDAAPRLAERVIVFGQGVVGLLITQLLRHTGVAHITAVDGIARRRQLATEVGADTVLTPGVDVAGLDCDLAIEVSGNPAALDQALASVAFGATVVVCSWYGTKPVPLTLGGPFHRRRLRVVSSQVSTIDAGLQPRWSRERRLAVACDLLPRLALQPLISHHFALERAAEAYRLVDERPEETVQVVLTYPDAATSRR